MLGRSTKALGYGVGLFVLSAATLVAQDAMVVGGSSLPPGVAPPSASVAAPQPTAPAPATSPFAPSNPAIAETYSSATPSYSDDNGSAGYDFAPTLSVPASTSTIIPKMAGSAPNAPVGLPVRTAAPYLSQSTPTPSESRGYYPGRADKGASAGLPALRGSSPYPQYAQASGGSSLPPGVGTVGSSVPPQGQAPTTRRSWAQKLGLGNISTKVFGHARAGAAARDLSTPADDGWEEAFVLDGYLGGEVSAITQTGIEYGVSLGVRGAYSDDGTLFGGSIGDCALGTAGCSGQVVIAGTPLALRGHSSQLFTGSFVADDEARAAIESAHIFVRTGYGDLTLGRDTGAAELFSLGAPQIDGTLGLMRGRSDFTGLSIAKSVNDPTGYAEKVTYTSPRLGGDRIGIGAQIGASYTPDVDACGAYTCYRRNGSSKAGGSAGAVLEDAWEVGISLDRTMGDIKAELTGTYATAGLKNSLAAFDDLQSWGIGAELSWRDFTLGGGYLSSNNALADGDWSSWDAGLAWNRGPWGARIAYAHSEDDNVNVEADEYTLGMTRALSLAGNEIIVGAGVQRVNRTAPYVTGGAVGQQDEDATAIYIETGWTF